MAKVQNKHYTDADAVAIFCSDIHLSQSPPALRSQEPDWFKAMARPLRELRKLQDSLDVPIFCAGDVFHKWNASPEVINFAIDNLPENFHAVPGQHDLPHHSIEELRKSAFYTLLKTQYISSFVPTCRWSVSSGRMTRKKIAVFGYPYGSLLGPCPIKEKDTICIAVAHHFVWKMDKGYPGAPREGLVSAVEASLKGYDILVFGDNHQGFLHHTSKGVTVFNCGSLMRRTAKDLESHPMVGVLTKAGDIFPVMLDVSSDSYTHTGGDLSVEGDAQEKLLRDVLEEVGKMRSGLVGFEEIAKRALRRGALSEKARQILIDVFEETGVFTNES